MPLAIVLEHFVEIAQHLAGTDQVTQHFVGEERVDSCRTETDEHCEMMRIASGGGFHQDVAAAAQPGLDQAVVYRTDRQRSMHRQFARSDAAIAQHQQHLAPRTASSA